jgi:hypothetical protein
MSNRQIPLRVPIRIPTSLLARVQTLVDVLAADPKLAALGNMNASSVVRLALEHGADDMEAEFGSTAATGFSAPEVTPRRWGHVVHDHLIVIRMTPALRARLERLVPAVAEHPLWQGHPQPSFSAILRMTLMQGLQILEAKLLPPNKCPSPFVDLIHVAVPGKPMDD